MTKFKTILMTSAALFAGVATSASAQQASKPATAQASEAVSEVVVTGTRIRQSTDTASPAPVAVINNEALAQKGYAQVGDILNELPSNAPSNAPITTLSQGRVYIGQEYPNLFNLGPGRTLSLMNGRRLPATSSGLGDAATDVNIIPTGLLDKVDVVQAGGAAVYGSGAIAGVVNYVMKDHFEGQEVQATYRGDTSYQYQAPSVRAMVGRNFNEGRGNVALEYDFSSNTYLSQNDRWGVYPGMVLPNPAPGAGANGIPASIYLKDWGYLIDPNGFVVNAQNSLTPAQAPSIGGQQLSIDANGNIVPKPAGTLTSNGVIYQLPAGTTYPVTRGQQILPSVERKIANLIGHYDITDHVKVYGEFMASHITANSPTYGVLIDEYMGAFFAFPGLRPLAFNSSNPYLSAATVTQLSALNPGFAAGQPLYLSKIFTNQGSKYQDQYFNTNTLRGVAGLSGDFSRFDRHFYWDVSYTNSEVEQSVDSYRLANRNLLNAANAVKNASGQVVCAINNPVVTDPGCKPLNIFGTAPIPNDVLTYIYAPSGNNVSGAYGDQLNVQEDLLGTLSGDLVKLPGGEAKFSVSYEHRRESAKFKPKAGDQAGIFFSGLGTPAARGAYFTNEYSAELEVPILGGDFTLPFVKSLDFNGSYRRVDNSLAGTNDVYSASLRWDVGAGLLVRATTSRNFRAPSIAQVLAPATVGLATAQNPCSRTLITSGPAVATRAANCLALFTANPGFGLDQLPTGVANTPANRLANFTGTVVAITKVTTSGNTTLENETADTNTLGFVYQPTFVPGLAISADILRVDISNGLTLFNVNNFAATCFDASPQPSLYCGVLGYDANGQINKGASQTVNAASLTQHSEIYNVDYRFPLSQFYEAAPGNMNLVLQATHNTLQTTTFVGTVTRTDGTIVLPSWVVQFDARYRLGDWAVAYNLNYLPSSLLTRTSTVNNSTNGVARVDANVRHSISGEYTFRKGYTVRAGINNLTNELPSYPTLTYGDIIGRNVFVSLNASF